MSLRARCFFFPTHTFKYTFAFGTSHFCVLHRYSLSSRYRSEHLGSPCKHNYLKGFGTESSLSADWSATAITLASSGYGS